MPLPCLLNDQGFLFSVAANAYFSRPSAKHSQLASCDCISFCKAGTYSSKCPWPAYEKPVGASGYYLL